MDLSTTIIGLAALVASAVAAWLALAPQRVASRGRRIDAFRATRSHLKQHRGELTIASLDRSGDLVCEDEIPLVGERDWIPPEPLDVHQIQMVLDHDAPASDISEATNRFSRHWLRGMPYESYSSAIGGLDEPGTWFNGPSYRLSRVESLPQSSGATGPRVRLTFCPGRYFDCVDTTESLAFEDAALRSSRWRRKWGPYRRWLATPYDLDIRCAVPGVNVLTLRCEQESTYFFMHHRGTDDVAVAMNTLHVAPAGEFQPHSDALPIWRSDLSLWRTTVREYAEEFLGAPDAAGDQGVVVDYSHDSPYRDFEAALERDAVRLYYLAVGFDPLTWKPEICLLARWEAAAFDDLFEGMLDKNPEGKLMVGPRGGKSYRGMEFTADNVLGYASRPGILPAAETCLRLAWRWRARLGLA